MVTVYTLTLKETNEKYHFTSLVALFEAFDYDVLRIKYKSLGTHSFKKGDPYENKSIKIERLVALSKGDVIKSKEKGKV